jgi:hypothetical protein
MGKATSDSVTGKKSGRFHAPYKGVMVKEVTVSGDQLTCKFTARRMVGVKGSLDHPVDKVTHTFQCESEDHAKALAEHAKKLHARKHRNGLIFSLQKLSEGITFVDGTNVSGSELLRKARERAMKKYKVRQEMKAEKEKKRRLEEERRVKSDRQNS